jgi:hypothetical protein
MQLIGIKCIKAKVKVKVALEQITKLQRALNGGGWSTARFDRFTPGKDLVPIV